MTVGKNRKAVHVLAAGVGLAAALPMARAGADLASPVTPAAATDALPDAVTPAALPKTAPDTVTPIAPHPAIESAAPIQAVMHQFGDTSILAYYTRADDRCALVVMTGKEPGPRVRVTLAPTETAVVEDVGGGKLGLTCGVDAAQLIVERRAGSEDAIADR